jgi:NADPH-dependent curcumin reductase CurA
MGLVASPMSARESCRGEFHPLSRTNWREPVRRALTYISRMSVGDRAGVLPLLNKFARVPISGLIAQYNGVGHGNGIDRLSATMREILSKSLMLRGFINYDFAGQHYAEFLREVGAGIADGRIRYREEIVDHLEKAPEAFIGMLDGHNFGKTIVRVAA